MRGMHPHVIPAHAGIQNGWERDENPPSHSVRGLGGCPHVFLAKAGNPEGTGWENHGNLSPIMAIMVQNLPLRTA